jgi:hypothetical protein
MNYDLSGFFRVLYDDPNLLSKLLAVLDKSSGGIPVSARSLLLDDYFSLAFASKEGFTSLM